MTEPIHIKLSPFQLARFAAIKAEQEGLVQRSNELSVRHTEGLTVAVGAVVDPSTIGDWRIEIVENEIVCTPPAPLELVKEA